MAAFSNQMILLVRVRPCGRRERHTEGDFGREENGLCVCVGPPLILTKLSTSPCLFALCKVAWPGSGGLGVGVSLSLSLLPTAGYRYGYGGWLAGREAQRIEDP